jgi:hyperosmotically inducible periplasmic protein
MKRILMIFASAALAALAGAEESKKDADNTGRNERDRTGETKTPLDQSNDPADVKITRDIRLAVMGDTELTATAKNVKIITTSGGKVTLRGPVHTAEEKKKIGRLAEGIAGEGKVENQIEVKAAK